MPNSDLDAYAAEWDADIRRLQTEVWQLEALAWDTNAAIAGNPVAAADLPRYGRERTLRLLATAMRHKQRKRPA